MGGDQSPTQKDGAVIMTDFIKEIADIFSDYMKTPKEFYPCPHCKKETAVVTYVLNSYGKIDCDDCGFTVTVKGEQE